MNSWWIRVMPGVFVFLWSTGFIGAKYGLPYAEPMTFLTLRFALVLAILLPLAFVVRAGWPRTLAQWGHVAVVGLMVHALYLGGVFAAIDRGLPAGVTALIAGLQPLLTAVVVGPLLGERVTLRQAVGFVMGFAGVVLVLSENLEGAEVVGGFAFAGFDAWAVALGALALVGITAGTLYQKRYCTRLDQRSSTVIQYAAATAATGVLAMASETMRVDWTFEFVFALGWLVVVLSIGAITLLMLLIRRSEASRTASLFYLVPPSTAVIAYFLFGEAMGLVAMLGLLVAVGGVAMVVSSPSGAPGGPGRKAE